MVRNRLTMADDRWRGILSQPGPLYGLYSLCNLAYIAFVKALFGLRSLGISSFPVP